MHGIHLMVDSIMADLFPAMGHPPARSPHKGRHNDPARRIVGKSTDPPLNWERLDPSMPIITMVYDEFQSGYIVIPVNEKVTTLPTKTTWINYGLGFFPDDALFVTRSLRIDSGTSPVLVYTTTVRKGKDAEFPLAPDFMSRDGRFFVNWKQYYGEHLRGLDDKSRRIMQQLNRQYECKDGNLFPIKRT
jgi:hypothetical protein